MDGIGIVVEDLRRSAEAAARADDRVHDVFAAPGAVTAGDYIKRVIPLYDDVRDGVVTGGFRFNSPRLLCADAGNFSGGTAGRVRVRPAAYQITAPADLPADGQFVELLAQQRTVLDTPPIATSAGGRVDSVYMTVTRTVPASDGTAERRIKNITTGVVTTEDVAIYDAPEVTVHVSAGTNGSPTPGTIPNDGVGSYNVPVCKVVVPAGYTSGGPLVGGSGEFIVQTWDRGAIRARAVALVRPAFNLSAVANADAGLGNLAVINSNRGSAFGIVRAVFRHTGANAQIVVDAGIDWRNRFVRITLQRLASQTPIAPFGNYPPPQFLAVTGGFSKRYETGIVWTGGVGDVSVDATAFWEDATDPVRMFINNQDPEPGIDVGNLVLELDDAPTDTGHGGDHYIVHAEYFDSDVE